MNKAVKLPHSLPADQNRIKLEEVYGPIRGELPEVERELARLCSVPELAGNGLHLPGTGGKRIRPALVLLSSFYGGGPCPRLTRLAVTVEVLHLATLVHDDIIDGSKSRRGKPTVNELRGENAAILTGDYLYALFLEQAAILGEVVLYSLSMALKDMVRAEIAQQRAHFNCDTGEEDYLKRTSDKAGAFLSCCCKLGARIAGASGEITRSLERFGRFAGISFQIKDDLLDFEGEAVSLGKPVAQDLRQGVLTLPVIHALRFSPRKNEIRALIERKELPPPALEFIIGEMLEIGSLAYAERMAERYAWLASRVLSALPQNAARDSFSALLKFIISRER